MKKTISYTKFHAGQQHIFQNRSKRTVLRCGRRFGKTVGLENCASAWSSKEAKAVGWFSPNYKLLLPSYKRILKQLRAVEAHSSQKDGLIELTTGGSIEFWTLNDEDAGRSRSYDEIIIDEASLAKNLREIWEQSIAPTLLDRNGNCIMAGTPKGIDPENFFYLACTNKEKNDSWQELWKEFHAPTSANPTLHQEAVATLKDRYPPLVYQQEYLAEFVDWSGAAFFSLENLTVNNLGVEWPMHNDIVLAVIDSAMKDGSQNDGTAVVYFAVSKHFGHKLTVLDWDIVQINSDLLINWLPNVFKNLEYYAQITKSRGGSAGTWIEDKASGITLLQTGQRMGWPVHAIEGTITVVGKDGRALSASGAIYRGEVKLSQHAFEKVVEYKGQTRNHLITQVCGFRVGDKDAAKRADDLLDAFIYGCIISLGGADGF